MICIESNEKVFERVLLQYGTILSEKELSAGDNHVQTREIAINGKKYFHYMVNGETRDIVCLGEVKTYRFYFSRFQKELHQVYKSMGNTLEKLEKSGELPPPIPGAGKSLFPRFNWSERYIHLADGREVEFTQICVEKGDKCYFKDAVLVAEIIETEEEVFQKISRR